MKVVCIETKYKAYKWDTYNGTLELFDTEADLVIGKVYDFEPKMEFSGFFSDILGYPKNLFITLEQYRVDIIDDILN